MISSELGSVDLEPSLKLFLFVTYHHPGYARFRIPQAQAFGHAYQDKERSVGKPCSSVARLMP